VDQTPCFKLKHMTELSKGVHKAGIKSPTTALILDSNKHLISTHHQGNKKEGKHFLVFVKYNNLK
jgi:hypothetical protein